MTFNLSQLIALTLYGTMVMFLIVLILFLFNLFVFFFKKKIVCIYITGKIKINAQV